MKNTKVEGFFLIQAKIQKIQIIKNSD